MTVIKPHHHTIIIDPYNPVAVNSHGFQGVFKRFSMGLLSELLSRARYKLQAAELSHQGAALSVGVGGIIP